MDSSSPLACDLKLLGSWASSYTHRVQLALKLKGLEFDYSEEDLVNKSPSLLLLNPIYNKVPILIHSGRPVLESAIILQYVDDTWPDHPLMPADPYDRAAARFWCHFVDDKLGPAVGAVFASSGEGKKVAVEQVHDNLKLIEREMREGAFKGGRFFGGEKIGFLDIVLGCGSYWLTVFEEVMEVKIVDPEVFPLFQSWLRDFEEQPAVKEIIPATDKLLEYARAMRQMMLVLHENNNNATTSTSSVSTADAGSAAAPAATTNSKVDIVAVDT